MKRMFNAIYPQVKEFLGRTGLTNNEIGWEWESGEENIFFAIYHTISFPGRAAGHDEEPRPVSTARQLWKR